MTVPAQQRPGMQQGEGQHPENFLNDEIAPGPHIARDFGFLRLLPVPEKSKEDLSVQRKVNSTATAPVQSSEFASAESRHDSQDATYEHCFVLPTIHN